MLAPLDAVAWLSIHSRLDGIAETRWVLKDGTKVVTYDYSPFHTRSQGGPDMAAGPTLLQRTWDMLDREVDAIKDPTGIDKTYHQNRASAIADMLAMFMVPHFETSTDIAREANRRWKARQAGEEYETAGLGSRMYEPPRTVAQARAETPTKKATAPRPTGNRIPEEAMNSSRTGITSGMFTVDQIAKMYSMTPAEVKSQLGLV